MADLLRLVPISHKLLALYKKKAYVIGVTGSASYSNIAE